jgi:hypothetical protein
MKTLKLTLHKQYFDAILRGEKKNEYRQIKKAWFKLWTNKYDFIEFTNGYGKHRPFMKVECLGIDLAEIEVDLFSGKQIVFALKLGKIIETRNIVNCDKSVK